MPYATDDVLVWPDFMPAEFARKVLRSLIECQRYYEPARSAGRVRREQRSACMLDRPMSFVPELHDVWVKINEEVVTQAFKYCACHGFRLDPDRTELAVTAHHHGDFHRWHRDATQGQFSRRRLAYVWYLHNTPRKFAGGGLMLMEPATKLYPSHNTLLAFEPRRMHAVEPVVIMEDDDTPSNEFGDARFGVHGWCSVLEEERRPAKDAAQEDDDA